MSMFHVTASEMQNLINELDTNNQNFYTQVEALNALQTELMASYTGDAATAFNTVYQNSSSAWNEFYKLVNEYITALRSVLNAYEIAEETNKEVMLSGAN